MLSFKFFGFEDVRESQRRGRAFNLYGGCHKPFLQPEETAKSEWNEYHDKLDWP